MLRIFFGLDLAQPVKQYIADWRDLSLLADGRPVPAANFHITLAFVGEVKPRSLDDLVRSVDQRLMDHPPGAISLTLDSVGFWPSPRIFWLGSTGVPRTLDALAGSLEGIGVRQGGRRQRRKYMPHVTLYRHCQSPPTQPIREPDFEVSFQHFQLFESRQGRQGVSYDPIVEWPIPSER